ncbi:MAG: hypothetical protein CL681_20620 [Blastopirellula sp.]|nr:hypothetical protein [Blastopirellula sp.]
MTIASRSPFESFLNMHARERWQTGNEEQHSVMKHRFLLITLGLLIIPLWGCSTTGRWISTPSKSFSETTPPAPTDYSKESSWAALPNIPSSAKDVPPGLKPGQPELIEAVDVFYLHPTSYFWRWHWNAPITGWLTRRITSVTIAGSGSAFNAAGQIYAPRYRQLTLSGFEIPDSRIGGLEVAYEDVRNAFLYYLEYYNQGKPFILVGHSQGSRLILKLLTEFFQEGDLRKRLIAAYPIGTWVNTDPANRTAFGIPICEEAEQTGCIISWRAFVYDSQSAFDLPPLQKKGIDLCVNPLSWKADSVAVPAKYNLGSIPIPMFGQSQPIAGLVGAQCKEGVLYFDQPEGWRFTLAEDDGSYHAYDVELFYVNTRENAALRARQWLQHHGTPIPAPSSEEDDSIATDSQK